MPEQSERRDRPSETRPFPPGWMPRSRVAGVRIHPPRHDPNHARPLQPSNPRACVCTDYFVPLFQCPDLIALSRHRSIIRRSRPGRGPSVPSAAACLMRGAINPRILNACPLTSRSLLGRARSSPGSGSCVRRCGSIRTEIQAVRSIGRPGHAPGCPGRKRIESSVLLELEPAAGSAPSVESLGNDRLCMSLHSRDHGPNDLGQFLAGLGQAVKVVLPLAARQDDATMPHQRQVVADGRLSLIQGRT